MRAQVGTISFSCSPEDDPDGSRLRGVLDAHVLGERARAVRCSLVNLLALLSLPLWPLAEWPALLSPGIRTFALAAWAMVFSGVAVAWGVEWRWRRQRARCLSELRPSP